MPELLRPPWSNAPNAPKVPLWLYCSEKADLTGTIIAAMFYGIITVLFLRCIRLLLDPVNHTRGGIRWPYVAYATTMFLFVTIYTAMTIHLQSTSFINNRNFPGVDGSSLSGPVGYQIFIYPKPIRVVLDFIFLLNNLLADGLLLYRCCIFYDMNRWAIALPCLTYLASFATGIAYFCQYSHPESVFWDYATIRNFGLPYYSISLALNTLLTVMIIYRLVMRTNGRDRNTWVNLIRTIGLYRTVVTMFVESLLLYLIFALLFIGTWNAKNFLANFFSPILVAIQVIATYLIILRVADRRALTRDTISGNAAPARFRSQGRSTGHVETIVNRHPMSSMDRCRDAPGEPDVEAENTIEEVPL